MPRVTMSAVAPAGGCSDFMAEVTPTVNARAMETAPMRDIVIPSTATGVWLPSPAAWSTKKPSTAAAVCERKTERGVAAGDLGAVAQR